MQSAQRLDDNPCRPRHFKPPPPCAPAVPDERANQVLDTCRTRMVAAAALFAVVFIVVVLRLGEIVLLSGGSAESHIGRLPPPAPPPPARADIVDRNSALLATMLPKPSLFVNSKALLAAGQDPDAAARELAAVLPGKPPAEIKARLVSGKSFAYLQRSLTPHQEYAVNRLGIPGLDFTPEERRFYPLGDLASHVIGYCGIDNEGLAGIERGLDATVRGTSQPLQLSLDARVQFVLREELRKVVSDFSAKGAAGIIMDVRTGEIVALVSLPDFDPNHPGEAESGGSAADAKERIFNKITLGDYEMGSAFKIFNTAMALDAGTATLTKSYDAVHDIRVGRFTITDYHGKHRMLSVPEVFMYSSNLGSARMAMEAGAERQRTFLDRLGLLKPVPIAFDELSKPHYPAQWREVNVITIAYGHGIAVSPLHVATAVSAIVNGGILHRPTLLKLPPDTNPPGERVISEKTSIEMRKLMRLVVEYGTAKLAAAPGYVVGGKTGTAEKNLGGHYEEKKLLSDFVAVFPMHDPRYLVLTLVDEPHGTKQSFGYATAGWTVAPATSRIIQRIAPILGVAPVDEASPAVTQALTIESLQGKRIESY
ncbi:MAG: penicillin-binding protein 2 [Alphaproteobacteria bacterium]|nr:penicillin-binding protein 2 [Alphaproteobacteria bacterium]